MPHHPDDAEPVISAEQFHAMLLDALEDEVFARALARRLALPVYPVQGSNPGNVFTPGGTAGYLPRFTTTADEIVDSMVFQNTTTSRIGIGTISPAGTFDVTGGDAFLQDIRFTESSGINYIQSTNNRGVNSWQPLRISAANSSSDVKLAIDSSGNVGIGTTAPGYVLDVKSRSSVGDETFSGPGLDDMESGGTFLGDTALNYKVQIDGTGTPNTFKWSDDGGSTWDATLVPITGGAQTLNHGVTVTFAATTGHTSGNSWTFSTTVTNGLSVQDAAGTRTLRAGNDGKLHIKAGDTYDGIGLLIEAEDSKGRIGFMENGGTDPANVVYRDTSDITVLRNFNQDYTILKIWAPPNAIGNDREATLTLARGDGDEEYLDVFNNAYGPSTDWHYGIRIQKRSTGEYRDFDIQQYNGNHAGPNNTPIYLPILSLKADRTAWFKSHGDLTNTWAGSDAIHATAAVKTTDANTTTLASITLVDGRAYNITARVVGRKSGGTQRAFYWRAALAYRQGGAATLQGTFLDLGTRESDANWDCDIAVSGGNDVLVRVKGVASTDIYWVGTIEYQSVSTDS